MKTLILDGSHANDPQAVNIMNALHKHPPDAETIILRDQRIGNCAGDFFCWVRNPGMCNTDDDNRIIAAKIMHSDLVISLTPVPFVGPYYWSVVHARRKAHPLLSVGISSNN